MAGGAAAVGFAGALNPARGAEPANGRHSDLPSRFTPSAYSLPSSHYSPFTTPDYYTYADDLFIERNRSGKPHQGKVLAAVVFSILVSSLFAAIGYLLSRGARDFTSVQQTVATRYEVLCEHKVAEQAQEMIAGMSPADI